MNSAPDEMTPSSETPESIITTPTQETQVIDETQSTTPSSSEAIPESKEIQPTAPQVIVEREKSFAYYVGFAFLTVLGVTFFFIPGISIVYLIHQINPVNAPTAWIFAAVLSLILWVLFKFKITGFIKATYFYLCFCLLVFAILTVIYFMSQSGNIFGNILAMLFGATP